MFDTVISARDLHKTYGGHEAVAGIDLDIRAGEVFAFLGPNGAGKTTTVEILEGYRAATSGEVRVLGADPRHASRAWRHRVGVVLQESQPEAELTARECLDLYAGYYDHPRPSEATLALVGLADQADMRVSSLSGGQRRRLDVGLALIGDPELLFLDEPTTGFDPSARHAAWAVIAGLRDLGKTIFLTTHYMDEAESLADRIAIIAHGRIIAEGTPATLGGRDHAGSRITFTLPPGVTEDALPALVREALTEHSASRAALRTKAPVPVLQALSGWAAEHGYELNDLDVRRPSLEDIYLQLTRDPA
jgi:ABC-2 type transport system ATP-binding protein